MRPILDRVTEDFCLSGLAPIPGGAASVSGVPFPKAEAKAYYLNRLRQIERAAYDVVQAAFGEWPDRDSSQTFEDWRAENLDRDDADADLLLVAVEDDRVVGAALCLEDEDEGWVAELAVPREHRGRGLGRGLLESAFQRFAARGRLTAGLSTDSRTGARTLYEHVGMTVTEDWARWALDLD